MHESIDIKILSALGSVDADAWDELVGDFHRTYVEMGDYYEGTEIVLGRTRGETGVVGAVVELLIN